MSNTKSRFRKVLGVMLIAWFGTVDKHEPIRLKIYEEYKAGTLTDSLPSSLSFVFDTADPDVQIQPEWRRLEDEECLSINSLIRWVMPGRYSPQVSGRSIRLMFQYAFSQTSYR